jgi:hypothetical protein
MSFNELLYFFWMKKSLIVPVAIQQLKDVDISCTHKYLIPPVTQQVQTRI